MKLVLALFLLASPVFAEAEAPGDCRKNDGKFSSEEGGCLNFATGLVTSMRAPGKKSFNDARDKCASLNEGSFKDWRLPMRKELLALSESEPKGYLPFSGVDFFWTSTENDDNATLVTIDGGEIAFEPKTTGAAAVCVRTPKDRDGDRVPDSSDQCNRTPKGSRVAFLGKYKGCTENDTLLPANAGCALESEYFASNGGGCQDLKTKLVWSKPAPTDQQRQFAARYCERLIEGFGPQTYQDWRLPLDSEVKAVSGKELAVKHFQNLPAGPIWTPSTSYRDHNTVKTFAANDAWYQHLVSLQDGSITPIATYTRVAYYAARGYEGARNQEHPAPVICVRSGP